MCIGEKDSHRQGVRRLAVVAFEVFIATNIALHFAHLSLLQIAGSICDGNSQTTNSIISIDHALFRLLATIQNVMRSTLIPFQASASNLIVAYLICPRAPRVTPALLIAWSMLP